jgi:restriction system protein
MKTYYRLYLGAKSAYAEECMKGNFIGVDFGLHQDLTGKFLNSWREFNKVFIPIYQEIFPEKKKVTSGLYCATIWVCMKGLKNGDIVLSPDGNGNYRIAEITGDYYYVENQILPHRRPVKWLSNSIEKSQLSESLKNSMGSAFTYCDVTKYHEELERLIGSTGGVEVTVNDSTVEDPIVFALEKHLEDFLVKNWNSTELGREYSIYEEEGEIVGQQYPSDTGPIDILAISKDKKTLLVVELKRGRVSDNVVGQIQRYMGFVKEELAEPNQIVKGVIIGLEEDLRIRRALSVTNNIEYYRYEVSFKLNKQ